MIVDTSAVVAILAAEDDATIYAQAIADASVRRLSAASYLECGIVLDNQRDPVISRSLDELLAEAEFVIEPVTERHARSGPPGLRRLRQGQRSPCWTELRRLSLATHSRSTHASRCYGRATISGIRASHPRSSVSDPGEHTGDGIKVVSCPAWV